MLISSKQITGLILAGGQGRRVQFKDKGLMLFESSLLIERQINWFASQVSNIKISANQNIEAYQAYGYQVIPDERPGYSGPLAGIKGGLKNCLTDWLYVQAVDVPFLPTDLIAQLCKKITHLEHQNFDAYYLKTTVREHYLSLLISKSCLSQLTLFLKNNNKKVKDFLLSINTQSINLNLEEKAFKNLNYLKDYT